MSHDPMCPSLGIDILPVADLCRCSLIARVRFDERSKTLDAAREAVAKLVNKITHPWASIGDALAAIDALRGK